MMDCKTVSDLMMKYLDGEIEKEQQDILMEHMNSCQYCHFEFQSMKETMLMLGSIEMEEAPYNLEMKVMSAIKNEDQVRARMKGWSMGVAACIVLLAGWLGLAAIMFYTPVVNTLVYCFDMLVYGAGQLIEFIVKAGYIGITAIVRLVSVGRAFNVMIADFREVYNGVIIAMILFIAIISEMHVYMQKTVRR